MITHGTIRNLIKSAPHSREITPFLNAYYKEMQLWGVYLSDIEFEDLAEDARDNFIESAYTLWKEARGIT